MEGLYRLILPDENKLLVLQQLTKGFQTIEIDPRVPCLDVVYYMYSLPPNIQSLKISNCNQELNRIFARQLQGVISLQLDNSNLARKKRLNQNQTRCLVKALPFLEQFKARALDLANSEILYWTEGFKKLKILHLFQQNNINDEVMGSVAECSQLIEFGVGGKADDFNRQLTVKGFERLQPLKKTLKTLLIRFVNEVGDEVIQIIGKTLTYLTQFEVKRSCFDTSEEITDKTIVSLGDLKNLQRLSLIYCRNFGQKIALNISERLLNIKYLCLRACPIFEDVEIFSKLTKLEELDFGGDSWVRPTVLVGVSKLKLKVFHMGHFDHGQTSCEQIIASYPPEGIFVHNLFKNQKSFCRLQKLYLEQCCTLTFWLDVRIKLARPNLEILYRQKESFE